MGTTGKTNGRRRSPAQIRSRIVDAAAAEIALVGAEGASLRAIARRVGVTHQALGYHFGDRRALLTAVAVDGFRQLLDFTTTSVAQVPPDATLGEHAIALGAAYVEFAREQPAVFALMLGSPQVDDDDTALIEKRQQVWQLLLDNVTEENRRGWGGALDPIHMTVLAWTIVHGMAALGPMGPPSVEVRELLRTLNRAIVQTPMHLVDRDAR